MKNHKKSFILKKWANCASRFFEAWLYFATFCSVFFSFFSLKTSRCCCCCCIGCQKITLKGHRTLMIHFWSIFDLKKISGGVFFFLISFKMSIGHNTWLQRLMDRWWNTLEVSLMLLWCANNSDNNSSWLYHKKAIRGQKLELGYCIKCEWWRLKALNKVWKAMGAKNFNFTNGFIANSNQVVARFEILIKFLSINCWPWRETFLSKVGKSKKWQLVIISIILSWMKRDSQPVRGIVIKW